MNNEGTYVPNEGTKVINKNHIFNIINFNILLIIFNFNNNNIIIITHIIYINTYVRTNNNNNNNKLSPVLCSLLGPDMHDTLCSAVNARDGHRSTPSGSLFDSADERYYTDDSQYNRYYRELVRDSVALGSVLDRIV